MHKYFTLTELIVVVGCLALLSSMTLPVGSQANEIARKAQCASNLRQSAIGMISYSQRYDGWVPLHSPGYLSWFEFPGMPQEVGLDTGKSLYAPENRLITLCPDVPVRGRPWPTTICYGTPMFHGDAKDNFNRERDIEVKVGVGDSEWIMLRNSILEHPAVYILLADSAYGPNFNPGNERQMAGNQAPYFHRNDSGFAAICKRHMDNGNVAFADGHVGDTLDRHRLTYRYLIGNLVSDDGLEIELTWAE